jgi:NADH-quinone oxidoreductase subunit N
MNSLEIQLSLILPLLGLTLFTLLLLVVESIIKNAEPFSYLIAVVGLGATAVSSFISIDLPRGVFYDMLVGGGFANFFSALILVAAMLSVIYSREYLMRAGYAVGEFYLMIMFATLGTMVMVSAADLIVLFLGIELMSVSLYVLAGFLRNRVRANESSLKYFLLGAFATGFLLYGIALMYGAAGTTNLPAISSRMGELGSSMTFLTGVGLLVVGMSFKVAAVPFHMWVPDVYEGAATPVSGFMSTGAKAAAFGAFIVVFMKSTYPAEELRNVFAVLAALSMIIGNVVAISQTNIKRMLAYSSIAHAGYLLVGLASANAIGRNGMIFYIVAYTFMNIGAFGVISLIEMKEERNLLISDYSGLGKRKPFLAALMSVFMFSLAGIPPFGGFFGKYYVFSAAVQGGMTWLAILGVLTSLVGVYYYLRVVVVMYFQESVLEGHFRPGRPSLVALMISAAVIIYIGIFPSSILGIIERLF